MKRAMSPARVVIAAAILFAVEIPAKAANQSMVHTVEKGDTLWELSKRTGCTVDQLRRANPKADTLRPGDRIELPQCGSKLPLPLPPPPVATAAEPAPPGPGGHHVVERG